MSDGAGLETAVSRRGSPIVSAPAPAAPAAASTVGRSASTPSSGLGNAAAVRSDAPLGAGTSGGSRSALGNAAAARTGTPAADLRPPPSVPSERHAVVMGTLAGAEGILGQGPGTGTVDALAELAAAKADIELRGQPRFHPSGLVGWYITRSGAAGAQLRAHFGTLATGHIVIRADDRGYQSSSYWLPMKHPGLVPRDKGTEVGLLVWMEDGVFRGMLGTAESGGAPAGKTVQVSEPGLRSIIFGRSYQGPEALKEDTWRNQLVDGHLSLVSAFTLQPPDGPKLTGVFALVGDDDARFMASGQLAVEGAESSTLEVQRTPAGIVSGHSNLAFADSWKRHGFSGEIETGFFDGTFEARGEVTIAYPDKKRPFIAGVMNVVATSPERAWAAARANDPSPHLTGGIQPTTTGNTGLALTAWGRLDLILAPGSPAVGDKAATSPLTARALFLVDPRGDITARGVLRMPREYVLVPGYRVGAKPLIDQSWRLAGADVFPGVGGDISAFVKVTPWAGIGPFSLRDLVADGTYSTRDDTGTEIKLAGSLNASAAAGMKAEAGIEAAITIGVHLPWPLPDLTVSPTSFKAGFAGEAVIRGYVDARPEIKVEKRKPDSDPSSSPLKYSIHGELHVAGEIIVKLGASVGIDVPDLLSKTGSVGAEYPLARGGISVTIDHEFGSDKLPQYRFDPINFDPNKFVRDMRSGRRPAPGKARTLRGDFRERDKSGKLGGRTPVTAEETPLQPPPDRQFELHVAFNIAKRHHDLYLVAKPGKSVVEMASGPRRPVSESIIAALAMAEDRHDAATTADELELYSEQVAELRELLRDVLELEAEANALAPEAEHLSAADIPGIDDLAESIAEYGVAYGDEELTGVARLLKGQIQETVVEPTEPETFTYLGARRIGTTHSFTGSFDDPAWNFYGVPTNPILAHPVNWWTGGGFAHQELYVAWPGGNYVYSGGDNLGWDARKWRRHVEDLLEAKKNAGIGSLAARKKAVIKDFENEGFSGLDWDDIWLEGGDGFGWQGHHVHETSWGGAHDVSNIQYLKQPDHHPTTTWWNQRRDAIKVMLDIPHKKGK
jgi:hypothetical protein